MSPDRIKFVRGMVGIAKEANKWECVLLREYSPLIFKFIIIFRSIPYTLIISSYPEIMLTLTLNPIFKFPIKPVCDSKIYLSMKKRVRKHSILLKLQTCKNLGLLLFPKYNNNETLRDKIPDAISSVRKFLFILFLHTKTISQSD